MNGRAQQTGFTIVELLIVIVVIAILAAITIVSYTGIQNRANDTSVQSDLKAFMTNVGLYHAETGAYPSSYGAIQNFKVNKSAYAIDPTTTFNVTACFTTNGEHIGLIALSKSGNKYYVSSASGGVKQQTASGWYASSGNACGSFMPVGGTNYNGYLSTATPSWRSWVGN